jgi:hypothetical protein
VIAMLGLGSFLAICAGLAMVQLCHLTDREDA